jgi:hypothetical protein
MTQSELSRVNCGLSIFWLGTGYIESRSLYFPIFRVRKSWPSILGTAVIMILTMLPSGLNDISDLLMYLFPQISYNTFDGELSIYVDVSYLFGFRVFVLFYYVFELLQINFFFCLRITAIGLNHRYSIYAFWLKMGFGYFGKLRQWLSWLLLLLVFEEELHILHNIIVSEN